MAFGEFPISFVIQRYKSVNWELYEWNPNSQMMKEEYYALKNECIDLNKKIIHDLEEYSLSHNKMIPTKIYNDLFKEIIKEYRALFVKMANTSVNCYIQRSESRKRHPQYRSPYQIEYRKKHKEYYNELHRKYRKKHKEELNFKRRIHYKENKEKISKQKQKYRKENIEKVLEYERKYYQEHKEEINRKRREQYAKKKAEKSSKS